MRSPRTIAIGAVAALGLALVAIPPAATAATQVAMPSDFNGDSYADLAIGVPGERGPGGPDGFKWTWGAGAVNVLYGSSAGLSGAGDEYWTQDSPGVKGRALGASEDDEDFWPEAFGSALATGDFDRDGYADLAIGVPGDWVASQDEGAVNVLYGSASGLTAGDDQYWTNAALGGLDISLTRIGRALASGDFNRDGYWDLAIGADVIQVGSTPENVAVIVYGTPAGLTALSATALTRSAADFGDTISSLAAGDLDGDGFADLAVGRAAATVGDQEGAGEVSVHYGASDGLSTGSYQTWAQDTPGIEGEAHAHRYFGTSLAIGDFDADSIGDLAIGVPYQTISDGVSAGAVNVLYGSLGGLTADRDQLWHQDTPGVPGGNEDPDHFGWALAAGDFDGDGADDLAIGVPNERGRPDGAGAVVTLRGGPRGLGVVGARRWTQNSAGVPGSAERYDRFGSSLASANYGRSGRDDLAIGVPGEGAGTDYGSSPGAVDILYGRASGLSGTNAQGWSQNSAGVKGSAGTYDLFGSSLTP